MIIVVLTFLVLSSAAGGVWAAIVETRTPSSRRFRWLRRRTLGVRLSSYLLLGGASLIVGPLALGVAGVLAPVAMAVGLVWFVLKALAPAPGQPMPTSQGTHSPQWWAQGGRYVPGGARW